MLADIRLTLLISLTILVLVLLFKWFKRRVMLRDLPVASHAELVSVEVMYHPTALRVEVVMPRKEELFPAMLSSVHAPLQKWAAVVVDPGRHVLELPLDACEEGTYYFELASSSQRTERRFNLRTT